MTEQELEDKYGSLKRDVGQDEEGMFFIQENDSGGVTDEGYDFSIKKIRIEAKDYDTLLTLGIL